MHITEMQLEEEQVVLEGIKIYLFIPFHSFYF